MNANREAWLAERKRSIGASEAAAAVGVSPWLTPIELWQQKTGRAKPTAESEAMLWGTLLEPVILGEYERRTGEAVGHRQRVVTHPVYPWMTATLDGAAGDKLVEVKTTSAYSRGFGDAEGDEIPDHYRVQIHHQFACTGATEADLVVLVGGQTLKIYPVTRDTSLVNAVEDRVGEFWECVKGDTPPSWGKMDPKALAVLHPNCEGEAVWTGGAAWRVSDAVDSMLWHAEAVKGLEALIDRDKAEVLEALGNAEYGTLPDGRRLRRYREEVPAKTVSYEAKAYVKHYFRILKGDR